MRSIDECVNALRVRILKLEEGLVEPGHLLWVVYRVRRLPVKVAEEFIDSVFGTRQLDLTNYFLSHCVFLQRTCVRNATREHTMEDTFRKRKGLG